MISPLFLIGAAAAAYQCLALAAALRHFFSREPRPSFHRPVSILKPVRGIDPHFYESIRSHAVLDYPKYEVLFGVSDPSDPAIAEIERLIREFPDRQIRLVRTHSLLPNGKVGALADLAAEARYPVLVVNDSDIRVPPDYLRRVVAPLSDERIGVVTCLYRMAASSLPGRLEALGVATDFAPGVLVAPLVGISEFGLGSTLAFRASDLRRLGGFAAVGDFIADDYQLCRRITSLGRRVLLSKVVVETRAADAGWREVWQHQVRWARTIRVSRGGGYAGLPLSNGTLWAVALALAGHPLAAICVGALRLLAGAAVAGPVLGDAGSLALGWLMPVRDLAGLAVWAAGLAGGAVVWRGRNLRLTPDGRIAASAEAAGDAVPRTRAAG